MKYFKQNKIVALLSAVVFITGLAFIMPIQAHADGYGYSSGYSHGGGNYGYSNPYGSYIAGNYSYSRSTPVYYSQPVIIEQPRPIIIQQPQPIYISQPQPVYIVQPQPVYVVQPQPIIVQQPQQVIVAQPTPTYYNQQPSISCSSDYMMIHTYQFITWTANVNGSTGNFTYSWSGTDYAGSNTSPNPLYLYYSSSGTKNMNVTVWQNNQYYGTASCGSIQVI